MMMSSTSSFHSNIPSENSSEFVTPYLTRSQSPDPDYSAHTSVSLLAPDPSSSLDSQYSKNKFIKRLLELSDHDSSSSVSTAGELSSPALEHLESCDSHVTILADSVSREEAELCSISFTHASVFDVEDDSEHSSGSSEQTLLHEEVRTRQKKTLSKDITNLYIGEMELEILSDGEDSAIDFEVKSSSPSLHEEDEDSGCATSIGSPDKTAPTLDFSRPGLFHLPGGLLHGINGGSPRTDELSLSRMECILDNVDLQSQHSSSYSESVEHRKGGEKGEESEEGKDEWPDLFADHVDFSYPQTSAMGPSLQPVNCPPMNGYVHPTPPPPFPPASVSGAGGGKSDSDPAVWMATINSHIRQQQHAVYQQHANLNAMMYSGYSIGPGPLPPPPPPPTHPPHPAMFPGPAGFPGFYPPLPPNGPPPPFPVGPGFTPIAPPPLGPNGEFLPPSQHPPPLHHTLPLSQSPSASNSEDLTQGDLLLRPTQELTHICRMATHSCTCGTKQWYLFQGNMFGL